MIDSPIITQMQALIQQWHDTSDQRAVFLSCYQMMTSNMLQAVEVHEFNDAAWVDRLLHHFADYYFIALAGYETDPAQAPRVWQMTFESTRNPRTLALQKLLLGVNAHINYDLVFTLVDLLRPEWASLSASQRQARYADHCHVNEIIARTIDSVQDQVLEPAMPVMEIVDRVFGSLDELLISRLITQWREAVWENAVHLLETDDPEAQAALVAQIERDALRMGDIIC